MVTLIGEGITVDELAHHFGTIGYEVLTSLGPRYARVYKGGAGAQAEPYTPRHRPDVFVRHENRDLQHQQYQPAAAEPAAMAARRQTRRRVRCRN